VSQQQPISTADYARLRAGRLNRLARLKAVKAPEIIILNERLLLLQARLFRFRPDRIENGWYHMYGRRTRTAFWHKQGASNPFQ
jgi:hypothetical protein